MNPIAIAVALDHLEEDKDRMRSSVELFWALFAEDSFEAHRGEVRNNKIQGLLQEIERRGDAITTAEMSVLAVHDPTAFAERLPERLREVTKRLTPCRQRDEPGDPEALFVAVHLWASRLAFYLIQSAAGQDDRLFGYGGDDVSLLAWDLRSLIGRFKASPGRSVPSLAQPLRAVESFWARTDTALAAQGADYARALASFEESHSLVSTLHDDYMPEDELEDVVFLWELSDEPWVPTWLSKPDLRAQVVADWFEALKDGPDTRKYDLSALAMTCDKLSSLTDVLDRDGEGVVDGEGRRVTWYVYWQRAVGWAEAQLTPDQLRDLREEQEDKRAEDRLRAYFFDEAQWDALPERARDELLLADKAWMSANRVRPSLGRSIPNGLRKATEHILEQYLWDPLVKWADEKEQANLDFRELRRIQKKLAQLQHDPSLADYTRILSDKGAVKYLQDHFEKRAADFIKSKVKKRLRMLKDLRDPEEHGKGARVHLSEIRDLYAEFMGLGRDRLAILPELARILTQPPSK